MHFEQRLAYQHPGHGDDRELVDHYKTIKLATAKWVGENLHQHYPGHAWHVEVLMTSHSGRRATGGIVKIRLNGIMPPDGWFVVQMSELTTEGGKRAIMRAGGELLERYQIHRGAFNLDDWRRALNAIPIGDRMRGKGHRAPLFA